MLVYNSTQTRMLVNIILFIMIRGKHSVFTVASSHFSKRIQKIETIIIYLTS